MRATLRIDTPPPPKSAPFAGVDLNDDFFSDLDKAFEQIQMAPKAKTKTKRRTKPKTQGMKQMKTTFVELTQVHLRPVLRYLKAIQLGVASKDLCEIVQFVVAPIISKTRKVGLDEHTKVLIAFQRRLKIVVSGRSRKISVEQREALAKSFMNVQKAFGLEFRGHSTAVVNLLGFYKTIRRNRNVTKNDLRKLFAIGIPSLTMLRKSSLDELVSLSGIRPDRMGELRRHARDFSLLSMI